MCSTTLVGDTLVSNLTNCVESLGIRDLFSIIYNLKYVKTLTEVQNILNNIDSKLDIKCFDDYFDGDKYESSIKGIFELINEHKN